jgi:hypothetical protein
LVLSQSRLAATVAFGEKLGNQKLAHEFYGFVTENVKSELASTHGSLRDVVEVEEGLAAQARGGLTLNL